ncbi:MAG TPA: serine/threonine-protein kinase, partial [Gemmatimonadales bacterium]|nr:serine/threonine-protein kinase [Gemmatimonadales bacterium]
MSALQERLQAGIGERYAIGSELGRGGMAVVYLAEDLRNHRRVAIKVLEPAVATAIGTDRFAREIEIAAGLVHPHILPLFDSGEAGGLLFYVMPYLEGDSLRARLDRSGALELDQALRITTQIGSALAFAHQQGFVHRDIKPENILLHGETAYLADFGIALALRAVDQDRLTSTGLSLGTPAYMSPEQASGDRHIDHRSDIYSLGSVLYEMLTGAAPFEGSMRAVVARILTETPLRPRAIRPAIPDSIEQAVLRAMAKMPADRFRSATDFVAALETLGGPAEAPSLRRRWFRLAAVTAGSALLAALIWLRFHPSPRAPDLQSAASLGSQFSSIAVLPFSYQGSDSTIEYLSDGIATDLIDRLADVPGLKVAARNSAFSYKGKPQPLTDIANKLNVDAVLEGTIARSLDSLRVTARLMDGGSELQVWNGVYSGTPNDVSIFENKILQGVVTAIGHEGATRAINTTAAAYDSYLKGRYH